MQTFLTLLFRAFLAIVYITITLAVFGCWVIVYEGGIRQYLITEASSEDVESPETISLERHNFEIKMCEESSMEIKSRIGFLEGRNNLLTNAGLQCSSRYESLQRRFDQVVTPRVGGGEVGSGQPPPPPPEVLE